MSGAGVWLLTPAGRGGVAVLELRGAGPRARLAGLCSELEPWLANPRALHVPRLVRLWDGAELLDEALLVARSAHELELHLHAGPALVARAAELLGGWSQPQAPSMEELAYERLSQATSVPAARVLLAQAEGALRAELERIAALSEAAARAALQQLLDSSRALLPWLEAGRLVLAGPVNAGKSTLFNALVGEERSLVAPEAGTTRDALHARIALDGLPAELFDTAGARELAPGEQGGPESAVRLELRAQSLARELWTAADLVLWLQPVGTAASPSTSMPASALRLWSQCDREAAPDTQVGEPRISALGDPQAARRLVASLWQARRAPAGFAWSPGTACAFESRQLAALAALLDGPQPRQALRHWLEQC